MTWMTKADPKRGWSLRLGAGVAISAALVLAVSAAPASARWDHRDDHDHWRHGWSGGYYTAPPVVYGNPYAYGYYPPPVAYGPSVGINLPGVSIGIR
ncbi:MAG TPA: hypothetical protein VET89_15100 [Stellaceae bacterium]|nr:hypothetical protein [Stellaceae bacterium]